MSWVLRNRFFNHALIVGVVVAAFLLIWAGYFAWQALLFLWHLLT